MGTLAQKLAYLGETKLALRQAINGAGGSLTADTPFRQYADWIREQSATLSLDFVREQYITRNVASMFPAAVGAGIITFTRSTGGGRFNAAGQYEWLPANTPRFDFDPVTGECRGLLIEEQRTRLNTISAAPSAAQSVAVSAVAHTLSFYGAGSIAISGAHVATVTGAGAFPARRTYTFTPAAGAVTLTPTGDVQRLQLEAGAFATSAIQGEGTQVTRAADIASVNELSPWYNPEQGTLVADVVRFTTANSSLYQLINNESNRLWARPQAGGSLEQFVSVVGSVNQAVFSPAAVLQHRSAFAYKENDFAVSLNGGTALVDNSGAVPSGVTKLDIGYSLSSYLNGHIRSIRYFPRRLSNDDLQRLTS